MQDQKKLNPLALILLIAILGIAAGLRLYNIQWDNGIFAHPDERSTVAFYAPTIQWPEDPDNLLNPRTSTLNPFWNIDRQERRSYTYGHFPLYTLVFVANFLNSLTDLATSLNLPPDWIDFLNKALSGQGFAQIGRTLTALADLFTVYLIFLIGRRSYGLWGGLLAATLSTFTVLQIQLAHFFAVDPITTTFTMLVIYGAMLLYERQSIGAALVTGLGVALAVASKFSALPVVFVPVVAGILAIRRRDTRSEESRSSNENGQSVPSTISARPPLKSRMLVLVILTLTIAFLIFALTSPFVLLDFANFKRSVLDEQGNMVSGIADFPFTRQYRHTTPYWYFIEQQLKWGMGWPLGVLALAGTLWVIYKAIRGRAQIGEILSLVWILLYFMPTGLFLAKFMRYMVPVVPLSTLFGAGLIVALWQWRPAKKDQSGEIIAANQWANGEMASLEASDGIQSHFDTTVSATTPSFPLQKLSQGLAITVAAIALIGSAVWALAFVNGVYGSDHSWVTFSRWIYTNIPDGSCIAYEHWDDRMPTSLPEPNAYPEAHNYRQPQLPMYDDDNQAKYQLIRDTLMNCDYIVLATNRLWRTIPRLPERYPMSIRYYEALFSGDLGFELVHSVETPPQFGPLSIDSQPADESFTVYDHPKPMLFKKTRQLSLAEWDALLGNTWQGALPGYVGSPTLLMRLRGATDNAFTQKPQSPGENDKSLMLASPVNRLPPVIDYRWNDLANDSTVAAILIWWFVVTLIGLVTFPLTFHLLNKLPDRGYALGKSIGLLLIGYFVWLNSSLGLLHNTLITIIIGCIVLVCLSGVLTVRYYRQFAKFWRAHYRLILITELVFSLVYLLFIYLRILNPDLWHPWLGGEKMLEIGFLNAIVKSAEMPPYDPFYAGGIINYYYYGLFLVGVLIKLTGIQPGIAFNLAIPTLAALTAINAFSLAGNITLASLKPDLDKSYPLLRFIPSGLLALLFIVFMGNLEGSAQFMRNLANLSLTDIETTIPGLGTLLLAVTGLPQALGGDALVAYNYWDPTRVIPETINEFPYFSFLFADLHPHMIGIPFTILFLSLAYNWLLPTNEPRSINSNSSIQTPTSIISYASFFRWLALPFILGALAVINTWDLPTYLGMMLATFLLNRFRQIRGGFSSRQAILLLIRGGLFAGTLIAGVYLLYAPFFLNYQALDVGLGLVRTQTDLWQHLKIWGFFLFIVVSWLWLSLLYPASRNSLLRALSLGLRRWNVWPHLSEIYRAIVRRESDVYQIGLWSLGLIFLLAILLFILGYYVPAYLFPLVSLALILLFRREVSASTAYLGLLAFTGLLLLLGVEFFFLRDFLGGGDYYRMNTLFKFFIQVWVMFGILVAVTLPQVWHWAWQWSLSRQIIWRSLAMILLMAGLIYPIFGTRTRVDDRFPGRQNRPPIGTLDGLAYMTVGAFEWPAGNPIELKHDYEAIRWLQENVQGTPIMAEAKIGYYREGGMRVAAYTGLPSILGGLHQNEQRYSSQISTREIPVNELWQTPDPHRALALIDQLNIGYIYIGQIERATYGEFVEDKFQQLRDQGELKLVFENSETRIYKREGIR